MKRETTVRLRILLLEDNPADAELILYELERERIDAETVRVITREDFEARLDPCPDAILSDYQLPLWTGLDALRLVRERGLEVPFIIISGTIGEDVAVEAMRHGADDYLLKDRLSRLGAALAQALERKRLRDEAHEIAKALRESEAGLHRAQVMARIGHVVTGSDGSFESWSATLQELVGVDAASMPRSTRSWLELLHPEDRATFRARAIDARRKGIRTDVEYRLRRPDGAWVNVHQVMEPILERPTAEGKRRWFNTLQDVTEQKRILDALRASEERHRATFENAAVGIVHSDLDGRIALANPKLLAMSGYSADEITSHGIRELTHPDDIQQSLETRSRLLAGTGASYERELRLVRKDGSHFWAHATTSVVRRTDGQPLHFVTMLSDVSERRKAEQRVRRLNRVYAVLSGINTLIVRVRDRNDLFNEACRIAVEQGGFSVAWLAMLDRSSGELRPIAWRGVDGEHMEAVRQGMKGVSSDGAGVAALAMREKRAVISNDIAADPRVRLREESLRLGSHALVALPLIVGNETPGVLVLHARETGFFDDDEMKLLLELAGDISFAIEHIEKSEKVDYLAYYDALTGLANRTLFHERLTQQLHAAQAGGHKVGLMIGDLERFKSINDSLGRQAGDQLLKQLGQRLRSFAADPIEVARVGADQFAVAIPDVKQENDVARFVEQGMQECLGAPFALGSTSLKVRAKVGIALYPNDGADADTLYRSAEAALERAKSAGNSYVFFAEEMTERVAGKLALEHELQQALAKEEFVLHYQPKVDIESRRIVGVEALIRWLSPQRGLVPPGQFIPLLEETGLILEVGAWAMRRAVLDHRHWLDQGIAAPRVAVNVSQVQLRQRDFLEVVRKEVQQGANPTGLDLEITESMIMHDIEGSIAKLKAARELGIAIAIDDFGTGYSSLGYLAKLPVQALKIDRSFIVSMASDPDAMTLISTIISLAHSLRLHVIAEGVETEEQARMLRLLRCDQIQGYLIGRPQPIEELTPLLLKQK